MASEWAMKSAQGIVRPLKARIYQKMSAKDYDDTWNRIADALDAAREQGRIEGLEEAFALATEHCDHGEFAHLGRYECIDTLRIQIRARIEELQK